MIKKNGNGDDNGGGGGGGRWIWKLLISRSIVGRGKHHS